MKTFKWYGIPVTLPDTKAEKLAVWLLVGFLVGFEAIVILVVGIPYLLD